MFDNLHEIVFFSRMNFILLDEIVKMLLILYILYILNLYISRIMERLIEDACERQAYFILNHLMIIFIYIGFNMYIFQIYNYMIA